MTLRRVASVWVACSFLITSVPFSRAQSIDTTNLPFSLPTPGSRIDLSSAYVPLMLSGLTIHPEDPLRLDFMVSTGNSHIQQEQIKDASNRLIKYFLACLTIPENDQWVNLSPYEKDRIVPTELGQTALGRDMLAQDYILKQLTASLIYPESNLGKDFWNKVYAQAQEKFGTNNIPVNTFNKVWILPDTAKIYSHNNTVYVVGSHLRVMLDEDYLAMSKHEINQVSGNRVNNLGNQVVREIVLPAIEKEVNTGANFSTLRQIYNSMILAFWYKKNLQKALLNAVYTDQKKIAGVDLSDKRIKDKIYQEYISAYKKGVFNYIKEEADVNGQLVPRKYFSGGLVGIQREVEVDRSKAMTAVRAEPGKNFVLPIVLAPVPVVPQNNPLASIHLPPATRNTEVMANSVHLLSGLGYKEPVIKALVRADTDQLNAGESLVDIRHEVEIGIWHPEDHPLAEGLIASVWLQIAYNLSKADFELVRDHWKGFVEGTFDFPVHSEYFISYKRHQLLKDIRLLNEFFKLVNAIGAGNLNGHTENALAELSVLRLELCPLDLFDQETSAIETSINGHFKGLPENAVLRLAMSDLKDRREVIQKRHDGFSEFDPRRQALLSDIKIIDAKEQLLMRLGSPHPKLVGNPAMTTNPRNPGGINLNAKYLTVENQGDVSDLRFGQNVISQFNNGNYAGLNFRILAVVPISVKDNI